MPNQPADLEAQQKPAKNPQGGDKLSGESEVSESMRESIGSVLKPESLQGFSAYKERGGALNESTYAAVMECPVSVEAYRKAMGLIYPSFPSVNREMANLAVKIMETLKADKRTKDPAWLLEEVLRIHGSF